MLGAARTGHGQEVVKAKFVEVMEGSINTTVDPFACIPLTSIRKVVRSGVLRMKNILGKITPSKDDGGMAGREVGIVAGSDAPIVIPLEGTLRRCLTEYFKTDKNMSEADAKEKAASRDHWYGVVDGMHRLLAIWELSDEDYDTWKGFSWPVTVLKGGHNVSVLKQLARQQNAKHSVECFVETTFYDTIRGLRDEAQRLSREANGKKPSAREVAEAFDGMPHGRESTVKQCATFAMRIPERVIEVIGEIINSEHPELASGQKEAGRSPHSAQAVMSSTDCRVYRKFVNITSLKSATTFMNAGGDSGLECQINTLWRLRDLCRSNGFKAASYKTVVTQFQKAREAMREAKKFEDFLETTKWPAEMEAVKGNLLRTTKFDNEVQENQGNDRDVLPMVLEKYRNTFPALFPQKQRKYIASFCEKAPEVPDSPQAQVEDPAKENPVVAGTNVDGDSQAVKVGSGENDGKEGGYTQPIADDVDECTPVEIDGAPVHDRDTSVQASAASEKLRIAGKHPHRQDVLRKLGIACEQMKWQVYYKTILTDETPLFDLVLTDPPYGTAQSRARAGSAYDNFVSDDEIKEVAQFCRRVLRSGGWVFLFTSTKLFNSWHTAFRSCGFSAPEFPFVVVKDTSGIQQHRGEQFLQNACEFAYFGRAPGTRNDGFKPNLRSPYHLIPSREKRKFAAVSGVPVTPNKLLRRGSRSPVLVEEKNVELLAELMETFCPEGGSVLDMYAGTFTTALACLRTGRKCTVIEQNPDSYSLAHERLRNIAAAYVTKSTGALPPQPAHFASSSAGQSIATVITSNIPIPTAGNVPNEANNKDQGRGTVRPGDAVDLLMDGVVVGKATVRAPNSGEEEYCTTLHGHDLAEYQKDGQLLVVVYRVVIADGKNSMSYAYKFGGAEEPPKCLGDIGSSLVPWDIHQVRRSV